MNHRERITTHDIVAEDLAVIVNDPAVDWNAFRGTTILIIGANGSLPAYMVETLLFFNDAAFAADEQVWVTVLVRNRARAAERFKGYGELSDLTFLVQDVTAPIFIAGRFDHIIHAASQASPKYYGRDPVGTMLANVPGCHATLELGKDKKSNVLFFSSGENIVMKSSGMALRPFCYLADAVVGFFLVLLHGGAEEAHNVGNPTETISIRDLAWLLAGLFPERHLAVVKDIPANDGSYLVSKVNRCILDIVKVQALGWVPRTTPAQGFRRTVLSYG